jgi:retron-type reverse transcriptase
MGANPIRRPLQPEAIGAVMEVTKWLKTRALGIPSVYDRICQQALANRLEPIFEKVFDPSSFGYRKGRKTETP